MSDQSDLEKSDEAMGLAHEAMWKLAVLCQPVLRRLLNVYEAESWEMNAAIIERLADDLLDTRRVLLCEKRVNLYDHFDQDWFGMMMRNIGAISCLAHLHKLAYRPSERSQDVIDAAEIASEAVGRLFDVSGEMLSSALAPTTQSVAA